MRWKDLYDSETALQQHSNTVVVQIHKEGKRATTQHLEGWNATHNVFI